MTDIPRAEYPRPQFQRERWLNLNGQWQFAHDPGDSGLERGLVSSDLPDEITVPFAPESELSGIGNTDFLTAVWYRREVTVPADWAGDRVLLHFQAVDYDATVWVDGVEVGRHRGGFTGFTVDLTDAVTPGRPCWLTVRARDDRESPQPRGKQSTRYERYGCLYTRTTGIWQTVWLESVPQHHLRRPRITPNVAGTSFEFELPLSANRDNTMIRIAITDDAGTVAVRSVRADLDLSPRTEVRLPSERARRWSPDDPYLYDITIELRDLDGNLIDSVLSYAGLRSVSIVGKQVRINGTTLFQRLVLDQGYYPDGIMTAPTDQALIDDIRLSQEAGFNGARLHQKVFEERFLYHADRMGYLVWGEFGDWGCATGRGPFDHQQPSQGYITQWLEAVERDYSHPSIVGWCPLNETWQVIDDKITVLDDVTRGMFLATKAMDTSRPVIDSSGYAHRVAETDIYDSHNYEQDPAKFAAIMAPLAEGRPYANPDDQSPDRTWSLPYRGQPYFCSEFGGIWWNPEVAASGVEQGDSWGYGDRPRTEEEVYERFEGLLKVLMDDPDMFGYCYTQLTDVFQEQNGIFFFDRKPKFDLARLRRIQTRVAAIEQQPVPSGQAGSE